MVVRTASPGPLHLAHNRGWAQPWPQVPRSSLGTLPVRAFVGGDLMGSVVHRKTRGPLGGRQGFQFPGDEPRDPVNLA